MAKFDNTAYIHCSNMQIIIQALEIICRAEGFKLVVDELPCIDKDRAHRMQYRSSHENDLWAIAVLPGLNGWSVLKTVPLNLLCEMPRRRLRPRISDLSFLLKADSFQIDVDDDDKIYVVEATSVGDVFISGASWHDFEFWDFYERLVWEGNYEKIPHAPAVCSGEYRYFRAPGTEFLNKYTHKGTAGDTADAICKFLTGRGGFYDEYYWGNRVQVEYLISCRKVEEPNSFVMYYSKNS